MPHSLRSTGLPTWARSRDGLELARRDGVGEVAVARDGELRVVAPLLGKADLPGERPLLHQRRLARLLVHPRQRRQRGGEGVGDITDHVERELLRVAGEALPDVELADRLAHRLLGRLDAALPARLRLLLSGEGAALEVEVLLIDRVGQEPGGRRDQVIAQVGLEGRERRLADLLLQRREELRRHDVDGREIGLAEGA
jgi:hypothetical protein